MRSRDIPGWVTVRDDGSARSIFHRPGEDHWVGAARSFHEGSLKGLEKVRSARTSEVYRGALESVEGTYFFKRYLDRDRTDVLKNFFRSSRARRALLNDEQCSALGFHLPPSACLLEVYRGGLLRYCALVSRAIEEAPNLRDWLMNPELGLTGQRETKRMFLRAFAHELGAWHRAGLYHGDLRLSNVLARRDREAWTFYWLDNERNGRYARLPRRARVNNLMRVNFEPCSVSATDRMRFWKTYVEHTGLSKREAQAVLKGVTEKTYNRRKRYGWL